MKFPSRVPLYHLHGHERPHPLLGHRLWVVYYPESIYLEFPPRCISQCSGSKVDERKFFAFQDSWQCINDVLILDIAIVPGSNSNGYSYFVQQVYPLGQFSANVFRLGLLARPATLWGYGMNAKDYNLCGKY